MKSKIARRLALYFAAALFVFTAVIGGTFFALFRAQTMQDHKKDLETRAVSIAGALSQYLSDTGSGGESAMMKSGKGGLGSYLRVIDDIAMTDVWVVDRDLQLITPPQMSGRTYQYADLPADAGQVVQEVFEGKTTFSEGFGTLLNTPTLTVGTPILEGDRVVGAVLLHAPVEGIDDAALRGAGVLGVSALAALALAVLFSVFLAVTFTKPLNRMERSALRLAEGDYAAKTGVRQKDEIGRLAGAIDELSDRLLAARQEGEKLEKLRREFVANISHELKTPVTVLRGSLEALCDGVVTQPEQVARYHRQMLAETLSLQRLVSDLLDLSRLQNADFKIEMQALDLCQILRDAARSAGHLAREKQVEIRQSFDTPALTVSGDYGRLRQMFLIVLDNAVKFSPPGGGVLLTLDRGTVSVRDEGRGISEEDLPHIFDRFYRVKSEENPNGSGLGLAIAKQIADRHGVAVEVRSRPGEGAVFAFRFPAAGEARP